MKPLNYTYQPFAQKVVFNNNILLWTESFGNKENPAILLIMGNGAQGIFWPNTFCEQLASKDFFVIRYDHRDTGLSTCFDYQQEPYTLLDMALDAIYILDDYKIKHAHIFGVSVGAAIACILANHFPERVKTLTLGMTSPDLQISINAFLGIDYDSKLSCPQAHVIAAAKVLTEKSTNLLDRINAFKQYARATNGSKTAVDEEYIQQLALQSIQRTKSETSRNNHFLALQSSYDIHCKSLKKVRVPTLIIHGDSDPIFPLDHAQALNKIISGSTLLVIPGLGHGLRNSIFYRPIINGIIKHIGEI